MHSDLFLSAVLLLTALAEIFEAESNEACSADHFPDGSLSSQPRIGQCFRWRPAAVRLTFSLWHTISCILALYNIYYWEDWLDPGPKNSNCGQEIHCRSRSPVERTQSGNFPRSKCSKSTLTKTNKKLKGSKSKRKKEKRRKQARLKKERLEKKKSENSKRKFIKDTHD